MHGSNSSMQWRVAGAIATTLAVHFALQPLAGWLVPPPEPAADLQEYLRLQTVVGAVVMFCAVATGTWVARGRFLAVALGLWAVLIGVVMGVVYRIQISALPTAPGDFIADFSVANAFMLCSTLAATLLGVAFGRWIAQHHERTRVPR